MSPIVPCRRKLVCGMKIGEEDVPSSTTKAGYRLTDRHDPERQRTRHRSFMTASGLTFVIFEEGQPLDIELSTSS